jgi:hypothetical protein
MKALTTARCLVIIGFVLLLPAAVFLFLSSGGGAPAAVEFDSEGKIVSPHPGSPNARGRLYRKIGYGFAAAAFVTYAVGRITYLGLRIKKGSGGE